MRFGLHFPSFWVDSFIFDFTSNRHLKIHVMTARRPRTAAHIISLPPLFFSQKVSLWAFKFSVSKEQCSATRYFSNRTGFPLPPFWTHPCSAFWSCSGHRVHRWTNYKWSKMALVFFERNIVEVIMPSFQDFLQTHMKTNTTGFGAGVLLWKTMENKI